MNVLYFIMNINHPFQKQEKELPTALPFFIFFCIVLIVCALTTAIDCVTWKGVEKKTKHVVIVDRPFGFNGIHCNNFKEDKLENKKTAGGKVLVRFQCLLFELIFCIPVTHCTSRGKTTSVHTGYFIFYVAITS